nr:hypothetical protein [Tanacetum cinerariifolium]
MGKENRMISLKGMTQKYCGKLSDRLIDNSLIDGYCLRGEMNKARAVFDSMPFRVRNPDAVTYNSFVESMHGHYFMMCSQKVKCQINVEESDCPPDNVTYNVLLQGYLKNKHTDDVERLLHEMDARGYSLDVSTLSSLMNSIAAGSL